MKTSWFVHRDGAVLGPFSADEVEKNIESGSLGPECLIWARGTNEWSPISEWKSISIKIQAIQKSSDSRVWYCDSGSGHPIGPLTQGELADHLRGLNRWDIVTLWGTGLVKWLPLFEVPEVMDLVGISRRENPRAPLLGQVALTAVGSSMAAQVLQALTVSIGGFGVKNAGALNRGDKVQISIKSREFPSTVHALGEIIYVSRTGDAGVKFLDITAENKAIITEHIRRFHDEEPIAA
ncbi:MAG: DUF4339 domain-containing protein [Deltaproteobacteria bacterium]|jgi:hypothetical protein|nr:DUF4339 domain-containing protein [Deltaproteobacteria bacterium]